MKPAGALHPRTVVLVVTTLLALAIALGWQPPKIVYIWGAATVAVSVFGAWLWNRSL